MTLARPLQWKNEKARVRNHRTDKVVRRGIEDEIAGKATPSSKRPYLCLEHGRRAGERIRYRGRSQRQQR